MKKIKAINNKIKETKAQYNLDQQNAQISVLFPRNVSKYEFLTGKGVLAEKDLLEKAAALEWFEYSPLCKKIKSTNLCYRKTVSKIRQSFWIK